jgi:hypothetical protein
MRLKSLFFPIILVISISIFIGYIWPEIKNVKMINVEKNTNAQSLQFIKEKQAAIESIGTQIANNSNIGSVINDYLPNKKVEERIIGGVNYLAMDSGVSLLDVSLKNPNVTNSAFSGNTAEEKTSAVNTDELQFSEVAISISGDYEKIKLFIEQLQRISLLNDIKSLTIANQIKNVPDSAANPDETSTAISSTLSASVVIDFGYLPSFGIDGSKVAKLDSKLDTDVIDVLKNYISQKPGLVVSSAGNKGKANPFLP